MKKIMVMLFGVAVAINAMAVDYTAKAVVTLEAESGYSCTLTLRQADEYGALGGSEMNMEGRVVALYALNGETPLQIAKATDLTNVKLGLLTDASTNYTITVSSVEGSETLYIHDYVADKDYALTEGAAYNFTATGSSDARFLIKKSVAASLNICFIDNKLQINDNPYSETIVIKDANGAEVAGSPFAANSTEIDLSDDETYANGNYTVVFGGGAKNFVVVKH